MADTETYVSTRRFGDVAVSVISSGSGRSTVLQELQVPEAEWRRAAPEADSSGEIVLGYNAALVDTGTARILIDLGFDDPHPQSHWREPRHRRSPGIERGLAALGIRPEEVTHAVITHAHADHFAGATALRDGRREPRFPRARHLLARAEWEPNAARPDPSSPAGLHIGGLERHALLDLLDGEMEVVPGVALLPAPGETPGHLIARVHSKGESFYHLGDLFHHPCEVEHLDWVPTGREPAAMERSRRELAARAVREGATLVFAHRPFPAWGRIVAEDGAYRWRDG
jgi:glyoxylase-like metal-dependent hydrolase (beta-lactamase superfamily II)